jgi:hypothetical protein
MGDWTGVLMAGYSPLKITGPTTGLVQQREEFLLPDDAYPTLQNAYVWRERILRKKGYQLLGRLQRTISATGFGNNLLTGLASTASLVRGSISIIGSGGATWVDNGNGVLSNNLNPTLGTVNYATGAITGPGFPLIGGTFAYYTGLPVMGIRTRELQNSLNDQTVFFDQRYAYIFNNSTSQFQEFIPGTTWNAHGGTVSATDFFWSTNYWVSQTTIPGTATPFFTTSNVKLFWVTNNTGQFGATADPIRITDGTTWVNFSPPNFGQIDATNYLVQCLSFLPFRGRMVTFNTWEGPTYASAQNYSNRIRWSTIGNPFIPFSAGPPATGSWRDDIRGQGGFLDIPTSEDIVSVGFVRDNLVIYCERSTWQLRYTGRSIAPFQIEKVNSELGGEGPFSAVQFDTSLVGIGDKGIVECDSYKSERIDIKIPDYVFEFETGNNGPFRVHGVRDFINRLAFWTAPITSSYSAEISTSSRIFPNQRIVYNYENDSWALFNDSLTTLGTYQPQESRTWLNTKVPWIRCNFSWVTSQPAAIPSIVGGNQQGFVEYLDQLTTNDVSLFISNIVGHGIAGTPVTGTSTVITSFNHNMLTGFVIRISGIPTATPYSNLNDGIFGIVLGDENGADPANKFRLMVYDSNSREFSTPQLDVPTADYIGGGLINIRENFSIVSKKFNFLDEGQNIQLGYLDILMAATEIDQPGAISLNVYLDYNDDEASNTLPQNEINDYSIVSNPDTFFNSIIPTTSSNLNTKGGNKFWQRVYCASRSNFLTLQYTFSNAQLAGGEQTKQVQIDAQILWIRKAGRMTQI